MVYTEALEVLVCPRRVDARPCHGALHIERLLTHDDEDPRDILEAILRCERCQARYPVVGGIPILHYDTPKYLRNNYYFLVGSCQALGCLSEAMQTELMNQVLLDLKSVQEELFPPQRKYTREGVLDFLTQVGPYLCNHYDDLASIVGLHDPLYGFLQQYPAKNPHAVLENFAARHSNGRGGLALDIGCHVGGFLARQAQRCRFAYGIDISFETLLLASQILKGRPRGLTRYRLYREGKRYEWRRLHAPRCQNVEFVVACGSSLPFKAATFDIVSSCNVVDIVAKPLDLLDEKLRVLKTAGLFLTSDPYQFYGVGMKRLKTHSRKSPLAIIKDRIAREAEIVQEDDYVPWITHNYTRHYMIYHNHCMAAIKRHRTFRKDGRSVPI
ncbi:MAG: methyltransferase domain-containing protein [Anaerolineae bacterium]